MWKPPAAWAWPTGDHLALIEASAGADQDRALAALRRWLASHDIDKAEFRDQRLLFSAVGRFGSILKSEPFWPRLAGLQRLLWTRARMAASQNIPSILALEEAGIPVLLIKGAAMAALPYVTASRRISHDIDVVVHRPDFPRAFDLLAASGWQASPGYGPALMRSLVPGVRAVNMFRDRYGDIDLHAQPFHAGNGGGTDDDGLWRRARMVPTGGYTVRIPSVEDALLLAIGHGGLDGHANSDWLIDAARLVATEPVNWQLVEDIAMARSLGAATLFTLAFLDRQLGVHIPAQVLARLEAVAASPGQHYWSSLVQMRPRDRYTGPLSVLRMVAKGWRKSRNIEPTPDLRFLACRSLRTTAQIGSGLPVALSASISVPHSGRLWLEARLLVGPVETARRLEFEINAGDLHLARARIRLLRPRRRAFVLKISGELDVPVGVKTIVLESRPVRQVRDYSSQAERDAFAGIPFNLFHGALTPRR